MDEREFLALAQALAVMTSEAAWRSAVSRAYYAAFHVARHLMEGLGFRVPHADRGQGHLWLRLSNCGDARLQQVGVDLNTLRQERNRADYDLHRALRQNVAQARVQTAELVILALGAAASEPTRSQARDEMIRYERDVLRDVTWVP